MITVFSLLCLISYWSLIPSSNLFVLSAQDTTSGHNHAPPPVDQGKESQKAHASAPKRPENVQSRLGARTVPVSRPFKMYSTEVCREGPRLYFKAEQMSSSVPKNPEAVRILELKLRARNELQRKSVQENRPLEYPRDAPKLSVIDIYVGKGRRPVEPILGSRKYASEPQFLGLNALTVQLSMVCQSLQSLRQESRSDPRVRIQGLAQQGRASDHSVRRRSQVESRQSDACSAQSCHP